MDGRFGVDRGSVNLAEGPLASESRPWVGERRGGGRLGTGTMGEGVKKHEKTAQKSAKMLGSRGLAIWGSMMFLPFPGLVAVVCGFWPVAGEPWAMD